MEEENQKLGKQSNLRIDLSSGEIRAFSFNLRLSYLHKSFWLRLLPYNCMLLYAAIFSGNTIWNHHADFSQSQSDSDKPRFSSTKYDNIALWELVDPMISLAKFYDFEQMKVVPWTNENKCIQNSSTYNEQPEQPLVQFFQLHPFLRQLMQRVNLLETVAQNEQLFSAKLKERWHIKHLVAMIRLWWRQMYCSISQSNMQNCGEKTSNTTIFMFFHIFCIFMHIWWKSRIDFLKRFCKCAQTVKISLFSIEGQLFVTCVADSWTNPNPQAPM